MKKCLCWQNKTHMIIFAVISILIAVFAVLYFSAYANPYMKQNLLDISDGWQYRVGSDAAEKSMGTLHHVDVSAGETLILTQTLSEDIPGAALMLKSNHQEIKVLLDGEMLIESVHDSSTQNPGMRCIL